MRIAISNIAWDTTEDESIAELLTKFSIDAIDIAPTKYFPHPSQATEKEIKKIRKWWEDHGIEITGMQSLLFGTEGLNIFGGKDSQHAMLYHLQAVCHIGSLLGAYRLVFGSPKNRDRSGLSDLQALDESVHFFRRLGDIASQHGVMICLEPNPSQYGANFMTNSVETAHVVHVVDHPAIRMHFDTGALTINREKPATILHNSAHLITHVHASEPGLVPLGDGGTDHHSIHTLLQQYLPDHVVSIEMIATREETHQSSIERALKYAVKCYRPAQEVSQ